MSKYILSLVSVFFISHGSFADPVELYDCGDRYDRFAGLQHGGYAGELPFEISLASFSSTQSLANLIDNEKLFARYQSARGHSFNLSIRLTPSKDWFIYLDNGQEHKSYLYFRVIEENRTLFKGIYLTPEHRGAGLMKAFFKAYLLFAGHFKLELESSEIYKPLFAKMLLDFGYKPKKYKHQCLIHMTSDREFLYVFPLGFQLADHLIQSQNMRVLTSRPSSHEAELVFVNTKYYLANHKKFTSQCDTIPGSYFF